MKRNTKDLGFQIRKDVFSVSVGIALLGVILGKWTVWHHIFCIENDIDYRELLSVLIGVLTTIVVTTYSLTIVALQLASVQFSPRILRWFFVEDRFNQAVLGCFIGTISYLLLLKSWAAKSLDFPLIAGFAIAILLICIVFPLFIAHIADSINAASIVRRIAFNLLDEIDNLYGKKNIENNAFLLSQKTKFDKKKAHIMLFSNQIGYIESINYQQFEKIFQYVKATARHQDITVNELFQTKTIGEFVAENIPLFGLTFTAKNQDNIEYLEQQLQKDDTLKKLLQKGVKIEKYRSYRQDINFGIRQIVDIAIKAISPAVNDPTTCINCLDYLGVVLRRLVQCPPQNQHTASLPEHLHGKEFGFREYIDHSFDQIYHFGKTDFVVVCRILSTLRSVASTATYAYHFEILRTEFIDIKTDILKHKEQFTQEGFLKVEREIEQCESALGKKKS